MKYREVLEEVETFLKESGIRDYCTNVCKGKCCSHCKSFQCFSKRNLACSTYFCHHLRPFLPNIGGELWIDKGTLNYIHIQILNSFEKAFGMKESLFGGDICDITWRGLTPEEFKKIESIDYLPNILEPIRNLNVKKIRDRLTSGNLDGAKLPT